MPPPGENSSLGADALLANAGELIRSLYQQTRAPEWGLALPQFAAALERSVRKRFAGACSAECFEEYLNTLYVEDLALGCACMQGSESAWEFFVKEYRAYLRASAGAIAKGSRTGTDAGELADALFAELFGLVDGKRGERSLFRYFHGRSSLKTWLRAILAQRHVDQIRESRRWESMDGNDGGGKRTSREPLAVGSPEPDPHRAKYIGMFISALNTCMASLEKQDRLRVEMYYARQMKLAAIGRRLGEHESSVSRNLERVRRELRTAVEQQLRGVMKLSAAECALCLEYAAEEVPIDFRKMFREKDAGKGNERRKGTP